MDFPKPKSVIDIDELCDINMKMGHINSYNNNKIDGKQRFFSFFIDLWKKPEKMPLIKYSGVLNTFRKLITIKSNGK